MAFLKMSTMPDSSPKITPVKYAGKSFKTVIGGLIHPWLTTVIHMVMYVEYSVTNVIVVLGTSETTPLPLEMRQLIWSQTNAVPKKWKKKL